jgi:hypothetical protein
MAVDQSMYQFLCTLVIKKCSHFSDLIKLCVSSPTFGLDMLIHTQQSRNHFWTSWHMSYWFIIGTAPTCFHVYSREYTCSACCQEFWTSLTQVILGQNWYSFTGTCHHVKNLWFHGKHVATHQICLHNPVNSRTETRELSQLNSWIHLQNMWNHGSLLAGYSCVYQTSHTVQCMYVVAPNVNSPVGAFC